MATSKTLKTQPDRDMVSGNVPPEIGWEIPMKNAEVNPIYDNPRNEEAQKAFKTAKAKKKNKLKVLYGSQADDKQ